MFVSPQKNLFEGQINKEVKKTRQETTWFKFKETKVTLIYFLVHLLFPLIIYQ